VRITLPSSANSRTAAAKPAAFWSLEKAPLGYNQAQYKALFRPINPGLSPSFHHVAHEI
jgi:hypothetical protein